MRRGVDFRYSLVDHYLKIVTGRSQTINLIILIPRIFLMMWNAFNYKASVLLHIIYEANIKIPLLKML